ncbi:MAG TPA: enoyl-CoA hydratase/isomerase family protein [Candidatus Nanopelagicales bacterium]|nr:enoyl-CoA hydratase/isomerase family protein [Candidatus Nanopelagicales bacterium]
MTDPAAPAPREDSPYAAWTAEHDHLEVAAYDDGVVLVTLAWPERRNAMGLTMTDAWVRLVAVLRADADLRVLVLTGAGSVFSSGGDTSWITSEPDATVGDLRLRMIGYYDAWLAVRDLEVPTIAALNGAAVGAAAALALACDLRYAAASARFAVPFTALGMHPGMGTTYLLPEVVGVAAARDLLLTGRTADAEEMLRLGIVSSVSGDDGFLDGVLRAAHAVAATAPLAARLTKVALARGPHADLESARQWEAVAQSVTLTTADLHEGIAASREKRRPRFVGR